MWNLQRCCDHCHVCWWGLPAAPSHWRSWLWAHWNMMSFAETYGRSFWLYRMCALSVRPCPVRHQEARYVPFVLWILNLGGFHRTWAARSNCCSWPVSGWSRQFFFVAWIWIILNPQNCSQCFARVLSLIHSKSCGESEIENPILSALPCSNSGTILLQSIFGGLFVGNSGTSAVLSATCWNLMTGLVSTPSGLST